MSRAPSLGERFVGLEFPLSEVCADDAVTFPAHAWPGGYPLAYYTADGCLLCADCATRQLASNRDDLRTYLASVDSVADLRYFRVNPTDTLAAYDVLWEGPPETCEGCNVVIPTLTTTTTTKAGTSERGTVPRRRASPSDRWAVVARSRRAL